MLVTSLLWLVHVALCLFGGFYVLIYSRHGMHVPDHDAAGQFQLSRHTGNVNSSVHFWLRLVLLCTCMF